MRELCDDDFPLRQLGGVIFPAGDDKLAVVDCRSINAAETAVALLNIGFYTCEIVGKSFQSGASDPAIGKQVRELVTGPPRDQHELPLSEPVEEPGWSLDPKVTAR